MIPERRQQHRQESVGEAVFGFARADSLEGKHGEPVFGDRGVRLLDQRAEVAVFQFSSVQISDAFVETICQRRQRTEVARPSVLGKGQIGPLEAFVVDHAEQETQTDVRWNRLCCPVGEAERSYVVSARVVAESGLLQAAGIPGRDAVQGRQRAQVPGDRVGRSCRARGYTNGRDQNKKAHGGVPSMG